MPVSLTTTTSQSSRSRRSLQQGGEVRRAGLLLALDQQLDGDRGGVAAGGGEVRAHAEQVEGDVALVVDRAAARAAPGRRGRRRGGLERRVHPQLGRVDRLHVVVAVDERDRRARRRRWATRRRRPARPASARSRPSGSRCGAAPSASHSALAATSAACAGSAEIDGMRNHASRSACRSSRWAETNSRSGLLVTVADGSAARAAAPLPASVRGMAGELLRTDVGDLTFDVRVDGPEDGRPVLLLHGFPRDVGVLGRGDAPAHPGRAAHLRARPARLLPRRAAGRRRRLRRCRTWRR